MPVERQPPVEFTDDATLDVDPAVMQLVREMSPASLERAIALTAGPPNSHTAPEIFTLSELLLVLPSSMILPSTGRS